MMMKDEGPIRCQHEADGDDGDDALTSSVAVLVSKWRQHVSLTTNYSN